MVIQIIRVEGMSCEHCKKAVLEGLDDLTGLHSIEVFLDQGQVKVQYDEEKLQLDNIKARINELGFRVADQDGAQHT